MPIHVPQKIDSKYCYDCKQWKSLDSFYTCKNRKGTGRRYLTPCKECTNKEAEEKRRASGTPPKRLNRPVNGFLVCSKCNNSKPLSDFYSHGKYKETVYYSVRCKQCELIEQENYRRSRGVKSHKERKPAVINGQSACSSCGVMKDLEEYKIDRGRRCNQCRFCDRRTRAIRNNGILENEFDDMMSVESCEWCGVPFQQLTDKCIDHCHETNTPRSIICIRCNTFGDDDSSIRRGTCIKLWIDAGSPRWHKDLWTTIKQQKSNPSEIVL